MRQGDWIQTHSGRAMHPLDPRVEEIDIFDIAHSLALQCRYTGHVKNFYSVGEHSVRVSHIVPPEYAMWGLLHDASEAYLTDMSRPVKRSSVLGAEYVKVEKRLMEVICEKFNLTLPEPPEVKKADNILLMTEKRDLLANGNCLPKWQETEEPLVETIIPWSWQIAEQAFINRYFDLEEQR